MPPVSASSLSVPARDLTAASLAHAREAESRIDRAITGVYEPAPGYASKQSVALQSASEAIGLLGESLSAAKAVEDNVPTDATASTFYEARTSLMDAQDSLVQGLHELSANGFEAATGPFRDAKDDTHDAIAKLTAAGADVR
jgi:hypothetical protein